MANTSYDEIYICFRRNCGVDSSTLPKTDEGKYELIHNAVMHYNTKVDSSETQLICNDELEEINVKLDSNRLLLLAYCLKYSVLENELEAFEQVWQPFTKEMGQKFYKDQIKGRENSLDRVNFKILELLTKLDSGSIMD